MKLLQHLAPGLLAMSVGMVLPATATAQASADRQAEDLAASLAAYRAQGCGSRSGISAPLLHSSRLDEAAQAVAKGASVADALKAVGYRATRVFYVNMKGQRSPADVAATIASKHCQGLMS